MAQRIVYHVVPNDNKGWKVDEENRRGNSHQYKKKTEAVAFAKREAKKQPLSQVIIHRKDGNIQNEYTYGKDPFPPKG